MRKNPGDESGNGRGKSERGIEMDREKIKGTKIDESKALTKSWRNGG